MKSEQEKSTRELVRDTVWSQIKQIDDARDAVKRAVLAKLRRGAGKSPGSLPEIWEYTIGALPDDISSRHQAEWAVHTALTLYALHKQGADNAVGGLDGGTLGQAMSVLAKDETKREAITHRFNVAVTSDAIEGLSVHARSLVELLRGGNVSMDYPKFASELYDFQFNAETTRLRWGRDYWKNLYKTTGGKNEQ